MAITLDGTLGITTPTYGGATSAEYSVPVTGFKNRIINGAMVIDQRNAGASVTQAATNLYGMDRWTFYGSQASKFTVQQLSSSPPVGFSNYAGITSSSTYSVGASELFIFRQKIEGYNVTDLAWGTANASTVTLSFWVYSSLTGTFGGSILNTSENYSYPFNYSIPVANTWTKISITITGPTAGTWTGGNGIGLEVLYGLGVGATGSGTAGSWASATYYSATGAVSVVGTSGATFYITGVQLEKGSTATSFDYRPYGTELSLCQRYFASYNSSAINTATAPGYIGNTTSGIVLYKLPVTPRIAPTGITINGAFNFSGTSTTAVSALTFSTASPSGDIGMLFTSSGLTAGQAGILQTNATSNYIQFTGFEL